MSTSRGLQTGPDVYGDPQPIWRALVIAALIAVTPVVAGISDGPDTIDPLGRAPRFKFAAPRASIGPFEFAPLAEVTPLMLKGAVPVNYSYEPDRRCSAVEISACKQDCMDGHEQYSGCEVKTVEGKMTRLCYCVDPGLRASLVCE